MTESPLILVTGGTGLVGKAIVNRLMEKGHRVRVLSRQKHISSQDTVDYVQGDIVSGEGLGDALSGCSAVFHCAGEKNIEARMQMVNVQGTDNIVAAAKEAGVDFFCHISSVGVIGSTRSSLVDEKTPCQPMNSYESSKLEAEVIVRQGLPAAQTIILRPTNIFGDSVFSDYNSPSCRRSLQLWVRHKENAHLVFVEDVAAAAVYFLSQGQNAGRGTYIVSSDAEKHNTIGEVKNFVRELSGGRPGKGWFYPPIIVPWLVRVLRHGKSNKGNIVYSSQKLFATGFQMAYGFSNGIRKMCEHKI